jgi:hypothetical protein
VLGGTEIKTAILRKVIWKVFTQTRLFSYGVWQNIYELKQVADSFSDDLYLKTKVYAMLSWRKVKEEVRDIISVHLIDWKSWEQ